MNKTTFLHLAAFELFSAIKVMAAVFVKTSYVITIVYACAPTPVVERKTNIFIIALSITVGVILWMAALSLVDVIQVCG